MRSTMHPSAKLLFGSIAVYAVVAACGSGKFLDIGDGGAGLVDGLSDPVPDARADGNQSGTRLKAKSYAGADGSKEFIGWHDAMLDSDCRFALAADGAIRCIPLAAAFAVGYFTDAGCTQPLVVAPRDCGQPTYAVVTLGGCPGKSQIFKVAAPFLAPNAFAPDAMKKCVTVGNPYLMGGYSGYSIGSEVVADTFVAATIQTDK